MVSHSKWNVTSKWNVIKNGISFKSECHSERIVTPNGMSPKIKCHSKGYVTQNRMSLNMEFGDRRTMRGTSGGEPHIPYQILNLLYQILISMSFLKEYVKSRRTAFHMPS
jgi:hypothetical protein